MSEQSSASDKIVIHPEDLPAPAPPFGNEGSGKKIVISSTELADSLPESPQFTPTGCDVAAPAKKRPLIALATAGSAVFLLLTGILIMVAVSEGNRPSSEQKALDEKRREQVAFERSQQAIMRVLRQENVLAKTMKRKVEEQEVLEKVFSGVSGIVGEYTSGLRSIDTSECPDDFRRAFLAYIHEIEVVKEIYARNQGVNAFFQGFVRGLDGLKDVVGANDEVGQRVQRARHAIEQATARYGIQ